MWTELSRLENVPAKHALQQARTEGWLQVHATANRAMVEVLEVTLDAGESEAIAMTMEWPADLLIMDESSDPSPASVRKLV